MKEIIRKIIINTAEVCIENFDACSIDFNIEIPKGKGFGDFSTNFAMVYANKNRYSPADIAKQLSEELKKMKFLLLLRLKSLKKIQII